MTQRDLAAFWFLGLLNNFLYVVMNAGAHDINKAGIGAVYLANVVPSLIVKLTGPYWFHMVSYRSRIWMSAILMAGSLFTVAWSESVRLKLLGVSMAAFQAGIGFAGIAGYGWSIFFSRILNSCFQLQLMIGLWIPAAFLLSFHCLLPQGPLNASRVTESDVHASLIDQQEVSAARTYSCGQRFRFTLSLWPYMVPLTVVFAAEYMIQAGIWSSMGFPVTNQASRQIWYQTANLAYQVGVFVSRSIGGMVVLNRLALWFGPFAQVLLLIFFYFAAAIPFGDWWLIAPAFSVGLLGGFVYVQAFVLIANDVQPNLKELGLATASLGDTLGIIVADATSVFIQGCLFGKLGITDTKPDFTCGYTLWGNLTAVAHAPAPRAAFCFASVH